MAVKETLRHLYGEDVSFFSDGDGKGSSTQSGVYYQLTPIGSLPLVAVRLDNTSNLEEAGLLERTLKSTSYTGLIQVINDLSEPVRISSVRMMFHKAPILDSGISKN